MKIIALNWKDTQTPESAQNLIKTTEDVANIYPDYEWIVFPGDEFLPTLTTRLPLGIQNISSGTTPPYCLIGHMSQRLAGKTDEVIKEEVETLKNTTTIPFLCIGPLREEDTLEWVITQQLTVLENWPQERPIVIAYEPGFAIWTGKTMTLEDIEIVTDILCEALKDFTNKRIIYGWSVNDTNIAHILEITDGVLIGTASQKSSTLLALSIALWQE
jgi:triosephosphate isomerase